MADNGANSIVVKVLNNTNATVNVTARLFNIGTCPNPKTLVQSINLTIQSKCARSAILQKPPTEWEVEYIGIVPEVFVFTAARTNADNAPLSASNFIAPNTFRHSEHVPTVDP
ncbi:hypothetical protein D2962_00545 [Biomaibacter acetigenes]|uniref:Uncharacterized protein n=1 Tax=Biomaibacter acetigenes TaxID=2316383 RepID=A0A3G2R1I6_9FIRM|nr:hypothetical protein D2962_00545 [Biomaibacter acetigenes]